MISFLEMARRYPIGAKVRMPKEDGEAGWHREVIGYEYYNGTGYLLFRDEEKMNVERLVSLGYTSEARAL